MDKNTNTIVEAGIIIETEDSNTKKKTPFNSRLRIFREFTLAALSVLAETKSKGKLIQSGEEPSAQFQVSALDAFAGTGITGLQWKKHLTSKVRVTLADRENPAAVVKNVVANSFSCTELAASLQHAPGDLLHQQQADQEIHVLKADAKPFMLVESFNFIYLDPLRNIATCLEPAMHSVTSDGLVCALFPDVSLFARSPHVVRRLYAADVVKTEYLKELVARIVLANLARAAARWNKGISPQFVLSHDDHLLLCIKISRGLKAADGCLQEIERLLHCRLCEERAFVPSQLAPLDDPYSLLSCNCKNNNPGKTAVMLGPAWKGQLYEADFLGHMYRNGKQLTLSARFYELIQLLIRESLCTSSDSCQALARLTSQTEFRDLSLISQTESRQSNVDESNYPPLEFQPAEDDTLQAVASQHTSAGETANGHQRPEPGRNGSHPETLKHKIESDGEGDDCSKQKKQKMSAAEDMKKLSVPFYYNVNKFKNNLPKLDKLVTILHCKGHRASRTHFDSCAIRTSANMEEFLHAFN